MLSLPTEYTKALEEVLNQGLSRQAMEGRKAKPFIDRIAKSVEVISKGLTKERGEFIESRYLEAPEIRLAYQTYYTTTNFLKIWPPLRELSASGFFHERKTLSHLDIGTGTGTGIWGLASYLKSEQPQINQLSTTATDLLPGNLRACQNFLEKFSRHIAPLRVGMAVEAWDIGKDSTPPASVQKPSGYDLITLMNVVNEIDERSDLLIIETLKSLLAAHGAIIMIEPSTREQSRRALRFRDRMVQSGLTVFAPCTRSNGCPALFDEDDWCHTEVKWERPAFIHAIDDAAGTLRLSLKFTYGVFTKQDLNLSDLRLTGDVVGDPPRRVHQYNRVGRVVSELFKEKGRARMFICNELGRREYVLNKRDKSESNRETMRLERYDLVQIQGVEIRENDVKLTAKGVIHILSYPDGCGNVDKKADFGVDKK